MATQNCLRCGIGWEVNAARNANENCESCRARRQGKVGECIIWHGHYADDMVTPIHEDGSEVLPGIRTCGHRDCCNPKHITKEETWQR